MEKQEIVVVGGGLVGSLLSIFLVKRGHSVTIYEQRPDMRSAGISAGRSINLIGTSRGLHALAQVGLRDAVLKLGARVRGRTMHAVDGALSYHPYGKDESEFNNSLPRGELNRFLMTAAEEAGARLVFEHRLVDAELDDCELVFEGGLSGETVRVRADRVIGSDGAQSALRAAFESTPGFETTLDDLGHGYKELAIPANPDGSFRIDRQSLHIWPRGRIMLMALPNRDGSFTVTLYLPQEGECSFASIQTPDDVRGLFEEYFPDAIPLLPDLTEEYFANPTGRLGTRRCNQFHHGDRALLIGDAAHAIVPFFGQGMNCGFEDCSVLMELIELEGDWAHAFEGFSLARKPNADAIADMSLENFVEMSAKVGDPEFLLRRQTEHFLENHLEREYRTRYSMVTFSHIPYHVAIEAGRIQSRILERLCEGLAKPEDVDLEAARSLIAAELTPFLERNAVDLAY